MARQESSAQIVLRPATLDDIPLLRRWDEDPAVVASDPNDDWDWEDEIEAGLPGVEHFIAELDGAPIGFLQIIEASREPSHYWGEVSPGTYAIDIWIGEAEQRNRGYGAAMMRQAIARCWADPAAHTIVIDPLVSNTAAIRFYERMGFQVIGPRRFGLDDCLVMALRRDRDAP